MVSSPELGNVILVYVNFQTQTFYYLVYHIKYYTYDLKLMVHALNTDQLIKLQNKFPNVLLPHPSRSFNIT